MNIHVMTTIQENCTFIILITMIVTKTMTTLQLISLNQIGMQPSSLSRQVSTYQLIIFATLSFLIPFLIKNLFNLMLILYFVLYCHHEYRKGIRMNHGLLGRRTSRKFASFLCMLLLHVVLPTTS